MLLLRLLLLLLLLLPPMLVAVDALGTAAARTSSERLTRSRNACSSRMPINLPLLLPLPESAAASAFRFVASRCLLPSSTARPSSSSVPVTRKAVRPLTAPVTLPPCVLMRSSTPSRLMFTKVPVTTKLLPSRQPAGEAGAATLDTAGEAAFFFAGLFFAGLFLAGLLLAGLLAGPVFSEEEAGLLPLLLLLLLLLLLPEGAVDAFSAGDFFTGSPSVFTRLGDGAEAVASSPGALFDASLSLRRLTDNKGRNGRRRRTRVRRW